MKNNKDKKTIIFDFDGVIVDSYDIYFEVHKLVRPAITPESFEKVWNGNIFKAKFKEPKVREIDFEKEIDERYKNLMIKENVKKEVMKLAENFRMFIVSSTWEKTIEKCLERNGLAGCFQEIWGAAAGKSKVEKIRKLCKKHSIDPSKAIFVTDTAGDVHEAKKAGIGSVFAIMGGFQTRSSLEKAKPTAIAQNFKELVGLINYDMSIKV